MREKKRKSETEKQGRQIGQRRKRKRGGGVREREAAFIASYIVC